MRVVNELRIDNNNHCHIIVKDFESLLVFNSPQMSELNGQVLIRLIIFFLSRIM